VTHQECINCKTTYGIDEIVYFCKKCGDILEIKFDFKELAQTLKDSDWKTKPLSVWRYRDFMPIHEATKVVTLSEGGTGLHRSERLGAELGLKNLYVKNEGENPTGSFKDRGMTVGVTKAVELGKTRHLRFHRQHQRKPSRLRCKSRNKMHSPNSLRQNRLRETLASHDSRRQSPPSQRQL